MTETSASVVWLTEEARDRLRHELDELSGPKRLDIVRKIEAAREEGDLRENGGYHAAKEEQGKAEARIRQLQQLLDQAHVGEPATDDGVVAPGMVVTAKVDGDEMRFLLGSREVAGSTDIEVYSPTSPLGAAIDGRKVGDTVSYQAPNGRSMEVVVVAAEPFHG